MNYLHFLFFGIHQLHLEFVSNKKYAITKTIMAITKVNRIVAIFLR